jgi:glucose-6-phosphate 1-epimerase
VLFVSSKSLFVPGKAIRGGVPVIFPWFGARSDGKPGPQHGYARSAVWALEGTRMLDSGEAEVTMTLAAEGAALRFRATIGTTLKMELETRNDSDEPFKYEEALHSYFAIADIGQASVTGLERTTLIDKTDGFQRKVQPDAPVTCAKETDQVHLNTTATCVVHDEVWKRRIVVEKTGSESTVVWNPWIEKTAGMADMGADDWRGMICVETANAADNAVTLAPGETHTLTATIRVE